MIVSELIELLKTMPQDSIVLFMACSEPQELEEYEIEVCTKENAKVVLRIDEKGGKQYYRGFQTWRVPANECTPIDAVLFPGN